MPKKPSTPPANHLRAYRMRTGLTQETLGALVGTKGNVIGQLENGTQRLTTDWLDRLAPHLDTTSDAILRGPPGDPMGSDHQVIAKAQEVALRGTDEDKRQVLEILETFVRRIKT